MTSSMSPWFTHEECNEIRMHKIVRDIVTEAFLIILPWLLPGWDRKTTSFQDYLKCKGNVIMKEFRSAVKPGQKKKLENDRDGKTWDLSLAYFVILWGSEFLAHRDDSVWNEKGTFPSSLESMLTSLKDERNVVSHSRDVTFDDKTFTRKVEHIRNLLKDMIKLAGCVCSRAETEITRICTNLSNNISKYAESPLDSKHFSNYKKQVVEIKGKQALRKRHDNYKIVSPASHIFEAKVPIQKVYTKMVLKGKMKEDYVHMGNILLDKSQNITDSIILVEGDAGVGKSTLTKKLVSDWSEGKEEIRNLLDFDLVLHTECRENIKSFKKLLKDSMSEIYQCFTENDFMDIIRDLKTLIIIDGLDELGTQSTKLFKEILQLKKTIDNVSVLITTRPEALQTYDHYAGTLCTTKHIQLIGIQAEKRNEFVEKYYEGLPNKGSGNLEKLKEFLKRTESRLGYLWKLPLNLTLLVVLWIFKSDVIHSITTSPELHLEKLMMYKTMLERRLRHNVRTQHLSPSVLKKKINQFLLSLGWEALKALSINKINLEKHAYCRLENECHKLQIPVEEMAAMFLKQVTTNSGTSYSFPHKTDAEFFAANYIFSSLSEGAKSHDDEVIDAAQDFCTTYSFSPEARQIIVRTVKEELKKANPLHVGSSAMDPSTESINRIRNILKANEKVPTFDLCKYKNVLIFLIGILHQEKGSIDDNDKLEAIKLIEECGTIDKDHWITILNDVRCDKFVTSYLIEKIGILKGKTEITDDSLFAYIYLLKSQKSLGATLDTSIDIRNVTEEVNSLLVEINRDDIAVKDLRFHHDFINPENILMSEEAVIQVLRRNNITVYTGRHYSGLRLSPSVRNTWVSVCSEEDYLALKLSLKSYQGNLSLCVPPFILSTSLCPLYDIEKLKCILRLYLPDIKGSDIREAASKAKIIQPKGKSFMSITFPRCILNTEEIKRLLREMIQMKVKVSSEIIFPKSCMPSAPQDQKSILADAKHGLGKECRITWYPDADIWMIK